MSSTTTPTAPPVTPAGVVAAAREEVAGLGEVLWAARTPVELLETATGLEKLRSTLDAVLLGVVAEIDATSAARAAGWSSTADFCTAIAGARKGTGRTTLALAKAVATDRAATGTALAGGAISATQASVIVSAVDRLPVNPALRDAAETMLIEDARTRDASELTRVGAYVLERLDPDGTDRRDEAALAREERAAHLGRFLSLTDDGIGGVRIKGRGTLEDAARIKNVLMSLAAPTTSTPGACGATPTTTTDESDTGTGTGTGSGTGPARGTRVGACGTPDCAHDGRDPREPGARLWDALVEACDRLAGTTVLPESHGSRPRIVVTIDADHLRHQLHHQLGDLTDDLPEALRAPGAGAEASWALEGCEPLSVTATRRLACDAVLLPVLLGSRGQILDVGRSTRILSHYLWLALVTRDRHCASPSCSRPPIACDAHHIKHWADGGITALHNLVLLCRHHHTIIHTTPWDVRINPTDHRPEFLPPARLDPDRKPIRRRTLRE